MRVEGFCFAGKSDKVDKKVNKLTKTRKMTLIVRKDGKEMASIKEKVNGGKVVSYKFRACLGRDKDGKQIFKCMTWFPPENLTLLVRRAQAKKRTRRQ